MAEKAVVTRVTGIELDGSTYKLYAECLVTDASITVGPKFRTITIVAESSNFNPLLPNWRARVGSKIEAQALSEYALTVDQVLFGDFGVLGL